MGETPDSISCGTGQGAPGGDRAGARRGRRGRRLPRAGRRTPSHGDAQGMLARSCGFDRWPKLKAAVGTVATKRYARGGEKGDLGAARERHARRPEIVDLLREGASGFEIRVIHIAVMARDVRMSSFPARSESGHRRRHLAQPRRDQPAHDRRGARVHRDRRADDRAGREARRAQASTRLSTACVVSATP